MRSLLSCLIASGLLLVLFFVPVAMASEPSSPPLSQSADESVLLWGGEHVEMELTKDGGTLQFDCATGAITKPLTVDAQGKFQVSGTFTRERPGPTMREGNPSVAATYSGSIAGETMHLTIVAGPNNESMGDYVLLRGKAGQVMKCR